MEPALAAKTSSLMSTKPPTAVMIPSVSSSGFKSVLDLPKLPGMGAQLFGRGVIRLRQQRLNLAGIKGVRPGQRRRVGLELLAQLLPHRFHVSCREVAA